MLYIPGWPFNQNIWAAEELPVYVMYNYLSTYVVLDLYSPLDDIDDGFI